MYRPKVVYWTHEPTPYTVDRWNAVARAGNIDFTAWFNVERHAVRSWIVPQDEWEFGGRFLKSKRLFGKELYLPLQEAKEQRPDLIIQEYGHLSGTLGFFVSRAYATRVAFRFLPTYETWFQRSVIKEATKHYLFRSVDAIKTAGPDGLRAAQQYGIPPNREFTATQAIDVRHFSKAKSVSEPDRTMHRKAAGLKGCVFIYVGRIWEKKGLDTLIDAFERISLARPGSASLLLVGDGIDEQRYRARTAHLKNVVYAGYVQKKDLPAWYALADVFVFPTLGDPHGLVVDEAMAAGLPVISSRAAGDIALRVPHGEAGYIVSPGDTNELADRMSWMVEHPDVRGQMARYASNAVLATTPERYAEDFEFFVHQTLEMKPRANLMALGSRAIGKSIKLLTR